MTALLALILGACRGPLLDLHAEAPGRVWAAAPVCAEVAVKAAAAGHSPAWLARLAYRESRLRRDVCSSAGACGPLQAVSRYWCLSPSQSPKLANDSKVSRSPRMAKDDPSQSSCDLVAAGVRAWGYYERRARGDRARALCWYTGRRGCV